VRPSNHDRDGASLPNHRRRSEESDKDFLLKELNSRATRGHWPHPPPSSWAMIPALVTKRSLRLIRD
jgi:hypothetical protein